ncbi:MAG: helix-turn-helix transcriptional regulator [Candidatus Binataceae bacterium]
MKQKATLGAVVKEARGSLGLTQRGLAAAVGVKASHIAYIEGGHRRPGLPLLRRLAHVLALDRRELLFLLYPDAKFMIDGTTRSGPAKPGKNAWKDFTSNRALLRRHGVTRGELKVLKQVSLLEDVSSPKHFIFVLNAIRQAGA